MVERQHVDYSKFTDFEIAILIAKRDSLQYEKERYDEVLNSIGQAKGFEDSKLKKEDKLNFDTEKLPWETIPAKDNPKGPWQKTSKSTDANFLALHNYISEKGTIRYQGSTQYWILSDGGIGRRTKGV